MQSKSHICFVSFIVDCADSIIIHGLSLELYRRSTIERLYFYAEPK